MRNTALLWSVVFYIFALTACLPEPETPAPPTPTPTPTITPTATATIVWFPPTATFTIMPTHEITPTPDLRPALGSVLLQDSFTDTTQWLTSRASAGNVAYGKGELTLAVAQPGATLLSLRKGPQLSNYYVEMDATPSLCRGGDMYGLLLRASSNQDYYRLMLTCSGKVRMERVKNAKVALLQDWVTSGQILPGGMARTRVSVWANGQTLSVYINDVFHFSIKDPVFNLGTLGVFARSAGDTPLTVSFSNLTVYSVMGGNSPVTPTPLPDIGRTPTAAQKP